MGKPPGVSQPHSHTRVLSRVEFYSKRESTRNKYLCNLEEQVTVTREWPQGGAVFNSVGIPADFQKHSSTAVTAASTAFPLWHGHSSWISQNGITNARTLSKESPNQGASDKQGQRCVFNSALLFRFRAQQLRNHSSIHSRSTDWIIFSR